MDDDRLTDSDEESERTLLINSDQRRGQNETDTRRCVPSNRDEHQPGTSNIWSEPEGVDSTDCSASLLQSKAGHPSSSKDSVCKAKVWPFKQRPCSKTSEKRSLSSSQENLASDRPRKNVKFCHKIKKYLFPSCEAKRRERERLLGRPVDQDDDDGSGAEPSTSYDTSSRTYGSVSASEPTTLPGSPSQVSKEFEDEKCQQCSCVNSNVAPRCDHFNLLPPQMVTHIFSFLTVRELIGTAALVCKHWERMSQASCLWLELRLRNHTSVTDEVLIRLGSRQRSVRLLDLSDCVKITNNGLSRALSYGGVLRELFLIRCSQLTDGAFLSIAEHCLNLIHLDLSSCTGLTDQALKSIAEQCPRLQKLRLKQCPHISDLSLQVVASSCQRLKVLTLTDNDKITDVTLESLATHTHNLEILCLQNCGIRSPGVMQLIKLQHLKKLDLSNLSTLTPEAVKLVAKHCTLLDTLNLSLSKEVSDDSVSCVAVSCKMLTMLFLISCSITDSALFSIGKNSRHLEHLDISWCAYITDQGAAFVSARCPRLKYLGLIRCNRVSDTVVEGLVTDHPGIHYSTFLLDSKRLIAKAREQGFVKLDELNSN